MKLREKLLVSSMKQCGATLVEVLVAIALTGIMLPALATALVTSHAARPTSIQKLQAESLLREATEATRSVREKGWINIATDGIYHPVISAGTWTLVSGSETVTVGTGSFTRQVVISTPQRNATGTIVASGGTNDPSTKHVVATVSWTTPASATISSDAYLTRWQNNAAFTQSLQADFNGGTLTNTCAAATCTSNLAADTVQLTDSPPTWQLPSFIAGAKISTGLVTDDVFTATVSGHQYAFMGYATGLAIVNVDNPAAPGTPVLLTVTGGVNGVFVSGTTAYLATSNANGQLTTVNVANPLAPTILKAFQIQDRNNVAATAVYVTGTTAIVVKKTVGKAVIFNTYGEINAVNVSNPSAPTLSSALNIAGDCTGVWVNGTSAFVSTTLANKQLTVVNIATPTNITLTTSVNLGASANDITGNGTTAYIATAANAAAGELRIYNVTTPATPTQIGTGYELGAAVNGVSIDLANPSYLVLATAAAAKQAIVVNIATPAAPTLVNNITLNNTENKIFVLGKYAYFASADTANGLTIVYSGFRPTGTFESSSLNAGATASFNYLTFTTTVPAGSTLKFQIATNTNDSTWNYVGPDGTAATFYTATGGSGGAGQISLNTVSGQYVRYKAFFTPSANGQQTPVISDVTVNYSL